MNTFFRIIILIIEFSVLFIYEFLHIKSELKNRRHNTKARKRYKISTAAYYSILNISFIMLLIFTFPNHIFLCYNKLIFLGVTIVIAILSIIGITMLKKVGDYNIIIIFFILCLIISPLLICSINNSFDFKNTINVEKTSEKFSNINNIIKFNTRANSIMYIITFNDKKSPEFIYENQVSHFETSNKTYILKEIYNLTTESPELKFNQKFKELKFSYYIYVDKNLLIDLTNFSQ